MSSLHSVKFREGKTPAEVVTTAQLTVMEERIVGFIGAYDVEDAAPEKPAPLAKAPAEAVEAKEAKAEKSK